MKLGIYWDLRYTDPRRHTGVGKHVLNVLRGLSRESSIECIALIPNDQTALWSEQGVANGIDHLPFACLPCSEKCLRIRALSHFTEFGMEDLDLDAVYSPLELLAPVRGVPSFTTAHGAPAFESTIPQKLLHSRAYRLERLRQRLYLRRARARCAKIFVVSSYLKDQVAREFSIPEEQLIVSGNGIDDLFLQDQIVSKESGHSQRLLCVGGINAFDGAPHLLQFANFLSEKAPEWRIAVAGDRHEAPWIQEMKSLDNIEWLGFIDSSEILAQMRSAVALLYFPLVESFGIIGLEAMAAGLPIIASRSTALPEVLGHSAEWVDPTSPTDIWDAVQKLQGNQELRDQRIASGFERVQRYRWDRVVDNVRSTLMNSRKGEV